MEPRDDRRLCGEAQRVGVARKLAVQVGRRDKKVRRGVAVGVVVEIFPERAERSALTGVDAIESASVSAVRASPSP